METNGAEPGARVLVVEDDAGIAQSLVRGLSRAGYVVDTAATGADALAAPPADVVLLDLGLPDGDGVDVCRRLRRRGDVAIIVVTARGEERDRVATLDAGADDYLVKPFGLAELLARVRAVLRRVRPPGPVTYRHGRLAVDPRTRRVTVSGAEVMLTPKEFDIIECLAADPGRVVSRQELLERVWDANWYGPTKVLDVHVAALRRKLGVEGLVETVYGRGFRLGRITGSAASPSPSPPSPSPLSPSPLSPSPPAPSPPSPSPPSPSPPSPSPPPPSSRD